MKTKLTPYQQEIVDWVKHHQSNPKLVTIIRPTHCGKIGITNTKMKNIKQAGRFFGISKGEWFYSKFSGDIVTMPMQVKICNRAGVSGSTPEEAKANKEMIAFAGNLAQHVRVEHVEELIKKVKKLPWSENKGVAGCTFGDTEYSSIDVCYGYNLAIEQIRVALGDIMDKIEIQS